MQTQRELALKLRDSRIIIVGGTIASSNASGLIFDLLTLDADDDTKPIQLYIFSSYGAYLDVMAVYDTIKRIHAPVRGICIGSLTNYSALLLASCNKGERFALKHSTISLSQPYTGLQAGGNQQTEILIAAKEARLEREVFEEALAAETGTSLEKIHADCENGIELNAEQAINYGIVDKVL